MIEELDPDAADVIAEIDAMGIPPWHALSVEGARRLEDAIFSGGSDRHLDSVRDIEIDGPAGAIDIRVYRPQKSVDSTLVFYHGGGWTLGTLDSADDICRELAGRGECLVLSVDYRLAPEHPFPAALEDARSALEWAATFAGDVGGNPNRLAVAGTSAGGNLAAATVRWVAEDGPDLDGLFLFYPIVDNAFDTPSYRAYADGPLLTEADMRWFWSNYLARPVDAYHPLAVISLIDDLAMLPPTTVVTAGIDVLCDEGVAFAKAVADSGVEVDHHHHPTLPHGLLSMTDTVDAADRAMDAVGEAIHDRLG